MKPPDFLHPFARPAAGADEFIEISRGEGACVFDRSGRRYIDALASLWYCQIGHGRREMVEAIAGQMRELEAFHCFEMFTNHPADELCRRLAEISPIGPTRVFLTDSGSEAVDSAIKLARLYFDLIGQPDRHIVIGRRHAYHGVTYGGLSVMGLAPNAEGWGPMVGGIGGRHTIGHDDLETARNAFAEFGEQIAAVIAEPVMAAGGVRPPEPGYLDGLRDLCDRYGALLILDEVVSGFGRLGAWWGSAKYCVRADLITFAKGVTSGYQPLGGVLVGALVTEALESENGFVLRTGHTYSGHPATCAGGIKNIEIIEDEGLAVRAREFIGPLIESELEALRTDGLVEEVRGVAGIWGVDVAQGISHLDVRRAMLDRGVIARPVGTSTIALCPPLVISESQLDEVTSALRDSLLEVAG